MAGGDDNSNTTVPDSGIGQAGFNLGVGAAGSAQGYDPGAFAAGGAAAGGGSGGGGAAAPANSQNTDPNAPGYFVAEDDFVLGQDGNVYQRQREGFRTIGWKPLGSGSDLSQVIAAAGGGFDPNVLASSIHRQMNDLQQQNWLSGASGVSGLTQQQLSQQAQAAANQTGLSESQWKLAASSADPSLTNEQYQQKLQGSQNQYQTGETNYDLSTQAAQHAYQDVQRQYGTQEDQYNLSVAAAQHAYQDVQRQYGTAEDQYNLANMPAQHNLQDLQRNLNTQQSTWQLAHLAQTQANDAYHLTQQGYENTKAASDRDTAGMGYSALSNPAATKLVGQ